ncbi:LOG family protein [Aquimarina rhabdastrellae]
MNTFKSIAVYCGSSDSNDTKIYETAYEVGRIIAERKVNLVYGGSKLGLMGQVANGALDHGGKAIGVIPDFLKTKEVVQTNLTELITVDTMSERKMKMHELSDAIITLPGGFGTMEELFEMLTWAQLGLHKKPIGLLNINGFYDDLIALFKTMVEKKLLSQENMNILLVADNTEELLTLMQEYKPLPVPKWMNRHQV